MSIEFSDLEQIGQYEWKIDKDRISGMKVPVVLFGNEDLIKGAFNDRTIGQAINATFLPGVVEKVCVMPDMHQGYGFPIGGVAATSIENGVISPGAIGYDINCGVRLLATQIPSGAISSHIKDLLAEINALCPSGVGKGGRFSISKRDLEEVCMIGLDWAQKSGFTQPREKYYIEGQGNLNPNTLAGVSKKAFKRGLPQLGSLGAGNHFIEIDYVEAVHNAQVAAVFGLSEGKIVVQIHSGSRGFGHQICTDFVRMFNEKINKFKYNLPDPQLICAPFNSDLGAEYLSAMNAAANFAFVNRQLLAYSVREAFDNVLSKQGVPLTLNTVYDLAHNIGKLETLIIDGGSHEVCVHRKGATRAFGPGNPQLPHAYQQTGQPVLIPGSMGTSSWVLRGTNLAEKKSLNSCCHGAGRVMSRTRARKKLPGAQVANKLEEQGIHVMAGSFRSLSEEAPYAYKKVNQVIDSIVGAGIAEKVAQLKPLAVIKG